MPLIDPVRLLPLLGPAVGRFDVDALEVCDSSSSEVLRRAENGAPAGLVVVADRQTAGRGRRGRSWLAEPENGLTFSLLWRFPPSACRLSGLSLAVGVAFARACDGLGLGGVSLKWPNDVLARLAGGDGKLAGILIELAADRRGSQAVIGIGANLRRPRQHIDQPVAGLADLSGETTERHTFLAALLVALACVLDDFARHGFASFRDEWQRRHAWTGRRLRVCGEGSGDREGECLGVDDEGALLLASASGPHRVLAGDISLRCP